MVVLLGAAAVLGMLIKFTVVIMVIAIVIDSLFHRSLKQTGMLAGISTAVICAGFFSFQAMIYPAHLDRDAAKEYNTPYLHWVMMGLKGDGGYNSEDYACQVIFFAILALMALSGLQEVLGRKQKETLVRGIKGANGRAEAEPAKRPAWCCMAPQVVVFGVMLFFAGWETSGRYITNYIPIILLSAVMGIGRWSELVEKIME